MQPSTHRIQVLLVDDERGVLETFARLLDDTMDVAIATSAETALEILELRPFDVLVTDLQMPGRSGLDLAEEARERFPGTEVVVMTGYADLDAALEAIRLGIVGFLRKPFRLPELVATIERCAQRKRMIQRLASQNQAPGGAGAPASGGASPGAAGAKPHRMIGSGPAMTRLATLIGRVQHSDATILITGETGSGKEVVARSLHEGSHRSDGPFIPVNCAALSEGLLESELFGHEAGAFTGAKKARAGLIEAAEGGTLFFDEIGEMPLDLQAKVLRVLQEKEVRRLGAASTRRCDVRFLAATNRDLAAEVRAGRFREDLFFRLSVFPITAPPLRQHAEDIPALADHFLSTSSPRGASPRRFAPAVLERLQGRRWPGNVRELENFVARLGLLADGPEIGMDAYRMACEIELATAPVEDLAEPLDALDAAAPGPHADPDRPAASPGTGAPASPFGEADREVAVMVRDDSRPPSLAEVESEYIRQVLEDCDGRKAPAARILGIHPSTLHRKLAG